MGAAQAIGETLSLQRTTLVLTRSDIEGLVSMSEVIAAVEVAHGGVARKAAMQPAPTALSVPSGTPTFPVMPSLADRQGLAAVKLLADCLATMRSDFPYNARW